MTRTNDLGQPIGADLDGWTAPPAPPTVELKGQYVTLEPLNLDTHASALFAAISGEPDRIWTYLGHGPFADVADMSAMLQGLLDDPANRPYVVMIDGVPHGWLEYLRIDETAGTIEIGWIVYCTSMQRTTAATEVQYLLMKQAFELGYRRLEWKCDSLNAPSRAAAERFGYTYEGIFRQATHYKGRNRDTAWFSILDDEWPVIAAGFDAWLDPSNFDADGNQRKSLKELRSS